MASHDQNADLQALLDRLAAGDESAVERLVEHSVGRLRRLTRFLLRGFPHVRRWYETDDVCQAAALRLVRALGSVRPATAKDFLNLAAAQVRRELCDLARHQYGPAGPGAHHVTAPAGPPAEGTGAGQGQEAVESGAGPATQARWRDLLGHVQEALPAEEREVFDLLFVLGLSQEEAASQLGVSVPTVKRRWRSARLLLHRARHLDLLDQ